MRCFPCMCEKGEAMLQGLPSHAHSALPFKHASVAHSQQGCSMMYDWCLIISVNRSEATGRQHAVGGVDRLYNSCHVNGSCSHHKQNLEAMQGAGTRSRPQLVIRWNPSEASASFVGFWHFTVPCTQPLTNTSRN